MRAHIRRICAGLIAALITLLSQSGAAQAQSCTFSMPSFDFGEIDLTLGTSFDLTANLTATCTGTPNTTIRFCPNIEGGTGGNPSNNPRYMLNGAIQLQFNIYRNSGFTKIWGSRFTAGSNPPQPRVNLDGSGNGTKIRPVRLRIAAGQTGLPTGLYTTSFLGAHTLFSYDYWSGQNCGAIGTTNAVQVPFTIQATHVGSCSVSATSLNFGTLGLLTGNSDATSSLSVTCTSGASYQVGLNGGLTGAVDPTLRKMASGPNQLTYGLYQNASRSTAWGDTLGTNTQAGTGTGAAQSLTVYGRVPAQTTPAVGAYSDTIIVTVTY